jgi:3-phosphoglycerate kinase
MDGLLKGQTTIEVPAETITAAQGVEWANPLGVKERVGQFKEGSLGCPLN